MRNDPLPPGFPKFDKTTRQWVCRNGDPDCLRLVPCASCRGRRNRRSGMTKQRAARKALEALTGADAARFAGQLGNEELWDGLPLRVEVKSGAVAKPVWTKFLAAENQSAASKAIGDVRPFAFVAMGQQTTDGLFVCRLSELGHVMEALTE